MGQIWVNMFKLTKWCKYLSILWVHCYPNDNLTQPMAQFGGLAWGQQYLQQILPRRVEEVSVSAKTGKRWAVTVTMSLMLASHCHEPSILGMVHTIHKHGNMVMIYLGWFIGTYWYHAWPHDTHFSHQNWCPQGSPRVPSYLPSARRRPCGASSGDASSRPLLFVFCVHRQVGRIFQVLLVAEAIAIHIWKRLGGNKMQ